jgi:catechol 2,3-dioxygenase-like lactoylglutathione lyase family enzyme
LTRLERVTPRLPVVSIIRTITFYRDVLGFSVGVAWPDDRPTFVIMSRDGVSVGFFEPNEHQPGPPGYAELYIEAEGVVPLHEQLKERVAIEWGPEVYSYGRREFAIRDPDGHLVIFTEETTEPPTTHEPL